MKNYTLARPYANSAFNLAVASGAEVSWNNVLQLAQELFKGDENSTGKNEFHKFLLDPRIAGKEKSEILLAVLDKLNCPWADGEIGVLQKRYFEKLTDFKRLTLIPEIAEIYARLVAEKKGEHFVTIESAYPMAKDVEKAITEKLQKIFGVKLLPTVSINGQLIGGFRAFVGSRVFDCSLATTLDNAAKLLKSH